jgi:hypothetical protein
MPGGLPSRPARETGNRQTNRLPGSQSATITEGDLIVIGAETYRIIGEPMGDALGLVSACEAVKV